MPLAAASYSRLVVLAGFELFLPAMGLGHGRHQRTVHLAVGLGRVLLTAAREHHLATVATTEVDRELAFSWQPDRHRAIQFCVARRPDFPKYTNSDLIDQLDISQDLLFSYYSRDGFIWQPIERTAAVLAESKEPLADWMRVEFECLAGRKSARVAMEQDTGSISLLLRASVAARLVCDGERPAGMKVLEIIEQDPCGDPFRDFLVTLLTHMRSDGSWPRRIPIARKGEELRLPEARIRS